MSFCSTTLFSISRLFPLLLQLTLSWCVLNTQAYTLITFDVDGTLVRGSGSKAEASAHARAFSHACGLVLGGKDAVVPPVAELLPRHLYHGSTDGLILCRLARAAFPESPTVSEAELTRMFDAMFEYVHALDDSEIALGIEVLPGVLDHLRTLRDRRDDVVCGLVTGNVEGIARRKMRAVGVWQTGALAEPVDDQINGRYPGTEQLAFLGGFGSDFCSRDVTDLERNHLDRAEQIAVAARRCRTLRGKAPSRLVHVGDAPADVLAARVFAERQPDTSSLVVGLVGVATGSYTVDQLREAAGPAMPGRWEPVILELGMADPAFLEACGI